METPTLFWISFLRDGAFAGACIVEAPDSSAAVSRADALGIHPGGETATIRIDRAACDPQCFEAALQHRDVLLTSEEEIEALFGPLGSAKDALDAHQEVTLACEQHSRPS